MRLEQARRILQLPTVYNAEAVRAAFVARCKALHPDAGGSGGDLAEVTAAHDLLIGFIKPSCKQCSGRGYIRGRIGAEPCTQCHGEGTVQGANQHG